MDIILASSSPRRKDLLKYVVGKFKIVPSDIQERVPCDMAPEDCPEYLACEKARFVSRGFTDALVIGCDTAVIIEDKILNKPATTQDARQMMQLLQGKVHKVITGCCICCNGMEMSFSEMTEVEFYPLSDCEIEAYVNTTEPYDKAGGYGIQGKGALFVKKINGDYYNVMGLPVARLSRELHDFCEKFEAEHFAPPVPPKTSMFEIR